VKLAYGNKTVYHVSRDSTAIPTREKIPRKTEKKAEKLKKKRVRPLKNTVKRLPNPVCVTEDAETSLSQISKKSTWGLKINSRRHIHVWKELKLHLDVSGIEFPLTACITGANVHDSQLAIPMEKLTEQKVHCCYSLMD
jgi:hypothetical protein